MRQGRNMRARTDGPHKNISASLAIVAGCNYLGLMAGNRFTLSEVANLVGAKPHAVQYWAREGILRPDPETVGAGRGKHRTFPGGEFW